MPSFEQRCLVQIYAAVRLFQLKFSHSMEPTVRQYIQIGHDIL